MHTSLAAFALMLAAALPGCATPRAGGTTPEQFAVMATVHQFVDGFNVGDIAKAVAACTDEMSIVDDFPPHEWHGAGAIAKWAGDFAADAQRKGISDGLVTLGAPRHVDVTGDRAYVVVPADFSFKLKGQPVKDSDAMFTLALQKGAGGWRITGWAWTKS